MQQAQNRSGEIVEPDNFPAPVFYSRQLVSLYFLIRFISVIT